MWCDAFGFGSVASALKWWLEPGTMRRLDQTLISHLHRWGIGEGERELEMCDS